MCLEPEYSATTTKSGDGRSCFAHVYSTTCNPCLSGQIEVPREHEHKLKPVTRTKTVTGNSGLANCHVRCLAFLRSLGHFFTNCFFFFSTWDFRHGVSRNVTSFVSVCFPPCAISQIGFSFVCRMRKHSNTHTGGDQICSLCFQNFQFPPKSRLSWGLWERSMFAERTSQLGRHNLGHSRFYATGPRTDLHSSQSPRRGQRGSLLPMTVVTTYHSLRPKGEGDRNTSVTLHQTEDAAKTNGMSGEVYCLKNNRSCRFDNAIFPQDNLKNMSTRHKRHSSCPDTSFTPPPLIAVRTWLWIHPILSPVAFCGVKHVHHRPLTA